MPCSGMLSLCTGADAQVAFFKGFIDTAKAPPAWLRMVAKRRHLLRAPGPHQDALSLPAQAPQEVFLPCQSLLKALKRTRAMVTPTTCRLLQ